MLLYEEILKKIEENKEIIKKYGVKKIGLFGPYVRGELFVRGVQVVI